MKKKLTLRLGAIAVALLMASAIHAQNFTFNVPGDYLTLAEAIKAVVADATIVPGSNVTINVAKGEYIEPNNTINNIGKAISLVIQGEGADKTTIIANGRTARVSEGDGSANLRFGIFNKDTNEGVQLTLKNLKFKYWGFQNVNGGGIVNINASVVGNFKVSLINCEFEAMGARAGAVLQSFMPSHEVIIDNCYFHDNLSFAREAKQGILTFQKTGKVTIRNSTFMSNDQDPINSIDKARGEDGKWLTGGVISFSTSPGINPDDNNMTILLENNKFINNLTVPEGSVVIEQPTISIKSTRQDELNASVSVTMINNIFIGNKRAGENKDIDIFFNNDLVKFVDCSKNILNSIVTLNTDSVAVKPDIAGFKVSSDYTYSDSRINFVMDGNLPLVKFDSNGVGFVEYSGDGGMPTSVNNKSQINNLSVISQGNQLQFKGLLPGSLLEIYSITGNLVYKQTAQSIEANVPLKSGIYIAKNNNIAIKIIHY